MAFVHGEVGVEAWAEDAGRKVVSEGGDEFFVGGGEFDEASEVGSYGVEGCDVGEAELAEGVLEDGDTG